MITFTILQLTADLSAQTLTFSQAIPNTVLDRNGKGTGFQSVQANTNNNQYIPDLINLDMTSGHLILTATKGTNTNLNTMRNGLQVSLDTLSKPFTASTRLKGPLTNLAQAFQQGGIFTGPNQDNYTKLAVINVSSGTPGLRLQFYQEINSIRGLVGNSSTSQIATLPWADIQTLDLYLLGNPSTGTITAYYRVNSDTADPIPLPVAFNPGKTSAFFSSATTGRAGILAFTSNAPNIPITFDSFGAQLAQQPTVVSTNPINGAVGVPLDTTITVTVALPNLGTNLDLSTISSSSILLKDTNTSTLVPANIITSGKTITFKPNVPLAPNTNYTFQLTGQVKDTLGQALVPYQISFTTIALQPSVTGTNPADAAVNVPIDTAISVDVLLPNPGAGVNGQTLNDSSILLFQTSTGALVPGTLNTTGGGDAIVFQPNVPLAPSTNYTFQVTNQVQDTAGIGFAPYQISFSTGTTTALPPTPGVAFNRSIVFNGGALTSLTLGPDGKLYATALDGVLRRWTVAADGTLTNLQTFTGLTGRVLIGLTFDPLDPQVLWLTSNAPLTLEPAPDFTGEVVKLTLGTGPNFNATIQPYLIGLPRSSQDHLTNSVAFGPDGFLYLTQGSNSAMGAPDTVWGLRPEQLLSAAVLRIDPRQTNNLPINVQTEGSTYDPYLPGAVVKPYATGIRNAYDLVWHSNGNLYTPTNGSAAGGNTPAAPSGLVPELTNVGTQNDYLFRILPGHYYGHPNSARSEYVLNGGNPTAALDCAEVIPTGGKAGYPVGVLPPANWTCPAHTFGRNRSPNGAIEYRSPGVLTSQLLVLEYSGGDDLIAIPINRDGSVVSSGVTQVVAGFKNPLDLVEDLRNGNLYVIELVSLSGAQITLLKPL